MDVDVYVEVEVVRMGVEVEVVRMDVEMAEWYIPWAVTLTPVLTMIPISSIFMDKADALAAPQEQEQECIPEYTQDVPPWLADMLLEGI